MTEITSSRTAGSDMPLESPTDALSALLAPVSDVPPVVPLPPRRLPSGRARSDPAPSGAPNSPDGRDRRDPLLEELVVRVLERDHDLGIILVGVHFALEGLGRAEGERGRDHAVDLAGAKRVVDERVLNHVLQAVVEQIGRGQGVGWCRRARCRPPPVPPPPPPPPAAAGGRARCSRDTTIRHEDVDRNDGRLRHELRDDARDRRAVPVDRIGEQ